MPNAKHTAHTAVSAAVKRTVEDLTAHLTAKRIMDLALGSALLALVAPALAAATLVLAVRAGRQPGVVLERSIRVGLGGRLFVLRSLRTRGLRLDLLSRLPHVVRGELSLVGPAPLTPGTRQPEEGYWREQLRPGLTGLAQVRARSTMPWDEPALLDAHYAEHHWAGLDLSILAQTIHIALRSGLRWLVRRGKARLSDTDHRLPRYSRAE
jgi:lipopolysaccharide/colanic/teichoic acid biosynthesis glycosyltransferase